MRSLVCRSESADQAEPIALEAAALIRLLPHRYPMLLVDRVQDLSATRVRGYKNVSANEPWYSSALNGLPNALVIESMAQLGAFWSSRPRNIGARCCISPASRPHASTAMRFRVIACSSLICRAPSTARRSVRLGHNSEQAPRHAIR